MNTLEFKIIGKQLQQLAKQMPLNWGAIQNDKTDKKLNLFRITNSEILEQEIKSFSDNEKQYFRRRWFLWQCSKVDEYLFYSQAYVKKNPESKDKNWDIEFNNNAKLRFDIKGTIVPKRLRQNFDLHNEKPLIDFYYKHQSTGVRNHHQNRLFIVHHSYYKHQRSIYLRCYWDLKQKAYEAFYDKLSSGIDFVENETAIAKCIFIIEKKQNDFSFYIN